MLRNDSRHRGPAKIVADNVQRLREREGLSPDELAHEAKLGEDVVRQIEQGDPDLPVNILFNIAYVLNVDVRELVQS